MNSLTSSPLFAALIMLAGSGTVAAIVTAWAQRGNMNATEAKNKADAAKTISDISISQTTDMARQLTEIKAMLRMHREWDRKVVKKCQEHGLEIDDPPELWF